MTFDTFVKKLHEEYEDQHSYSNGSCGEWALAAGAIAESLGLSVDYVVAVDKYDDPQHLFLIDNNIVTYFDHKTETDNPYEIVTSWTVKEVADMLSAEDVYNHCYNFFHFELVGVESLIEEMCELFGIDIQDVESTFHKEVFEHEYTD